MTSELARKIAYARSLDPVGSPCIDICKIDETHQWCRGCLRTRDEIRAWKTLGNAEKQDILDVVLERSAKTTKID